MLKIDYLNKEWEERRLIYNENNLSEMWSDILSIIDNEFTNITVWRL